MISDENDYYAEECLLSMSTVKRHNSDCNIILITDEATFKGLNNGRERIKEYITETKIIDLPENNSKIFRSRFLKTGLREYVSGDYLYLDTDTLILNSLSAIFENTHDMVAVLEEHIDDVNLYQLNNYRSMTSLPEEIFGKYFNSGVLFVKDTPASHKLYHDWHTYWLEDVKKYDYFSDQPALSKAVKLNHDVINELDGKYNCQMECLNSKLFKLTTEWLNLLSDAVVIHYFNKKKETHFFPLKQVDFLKKIRENGITDEVKKVLIQPHPYYYNNWINRLLVENKRIHDKPILKLERLFINRYLITLKRWMKLLIKK